MSHAFTSLEQAQVRPVNDAGETESDIDRTFVYSTLPSHLRLRANIRALRRFVLGEVPGYQAAVNTATTELRREESVGGPAANALIETLANHGHYL